MDLKKFADKAKQVVDGRGGVDSLKEDAQQLRDIAKGGGSVSDKAKEAVAAIKDPGEGGELAGTAADPTAQTAPVAKPAPVQPESEPGAAPQDPVADNLGADDERERRHRGGGGGGGRHGGGHGRGHGGQGGGRGADEQG
jgi:hypothetical protein